MENRRSTDDEISRGMLKEMENRKTDKIRVAKAERERRKERRF